MADHFHFFNFIFYGLNFKVHANLHLKIKLKWVKFKMLSQNGMSNHKNKDVDYIKWIIIGGDKYLNDNKNNYYL